MFTENDAALFLKFEGHYEKGKIAFPERKKPFS